MQKIKYIFHIISSQLAIVFLKKGPVGCILLSQSSIFFIAYVFIYFADQGPSSQGYGFSSGHVWMWELDCEEGWVPKDWCFWTVVLEKTLESPLDCKEISPGISLEGMMLKLKLQYSGHLMRRVDSLEKTLMLGGTGGRRRTIWTFISNAMSLLFNMLSRLVIALFPRSKHLWISWLQSPSAVIFEPKKEPCFLEQV